jgi:hypothetical protein
MTIPWYIGLEEIKQFLGINSSTNNDRLRSLIGAISRFIDNYTGRKFYPTTATRLFDYQSATILQLDYDDLLSVSAFADENGTGTVDTSYLLYEPANNPPYQRIIIDPSNDSFMYSNIKEQALEVTGEWGYCNSKEDTGITCPSLTLDTTTMAANNGKKVDVGWLLQIDDERIIVTDVDAVDSAANTSAALNDYETDIGVTDTSKFSTGEIIRIEDEQMRIVRIDTSSLSVIRGYEGTTPKSHESNKDIYVYRNFTIERGATKSAASQHSAGTKIYRIAPPSDIIYVCGVLVARANRRSESGWSDATVVGGEGIGTTIFTRIMPREIEAILTNYIRLPIGAA